MTRKPASITDVASRAGVAIATVSRYFNSPEIVSYATRKRIELAVRELGYMRNRMAGSIRNRGTGAVGLVVPTIDNAIFSELVQAFSTRLSQLNRTLLIASHNYNPQTESALVRSFLESRVDAVALIGLDHDPDIVELLNDREVPFVSIWNYSKHAGYPCIGIDNEHLGWLAARQIIDLGHQKIAFLFGEQASNDRARDRLRGALKAAREAGVAIPKMWLDETPYDLATIKERVQKLIIGPDRPTALVCGNDIIAQGAVFAVQSLQRRVPDDLSVVGIGDFRGSAEMEPALSTIRIPARRIGMEAADMMLAELNARRSKDQTRCASVLIEPILKLRASTCRLTM